ncbi:MAG: guanylate kinase [Simkaniaceae bacterium]
MSRLLGHLDKGLIFVVSAPSGAGKTTLVKRLIRDLPVCKRSVSCTTRTKREGESDGKDYFFLSKEAFQQKEDEGAFLETASVFGHEYGTLKSTIEGITNRGHHAFLVIDTQGAAKLRKEIEAIFIFILPPSIEELKARLKKRGSEDEKTKQLRLDESTKEMAQASNYDYQIINDDLDTAYEILRSIVIAEEYKVRNKT